tara:strand:- start:834 stop:1568 length:735 start_codon:yes stop_codon:yes gene_type:complete
MDKKYIFICGLHRSGKSTLTNIISTSNLVSIHTHKNSIDIEGQHIQTVYDAAYKHGGPGKFGFDKKYHYTEKTYLLTQKNNDKIINDWSKFWDLNKPILVEQSPPNIIHTRYLQEIVDKSYFIIIIRHPLSVALATEKYMTQTLDKHIEHWLHVHEILYNDLKKIKNYLILKNEKLNIDTFEHKINNFLDEKLCIDCKILKKNINSMKIYNEKNFQYKVSDYIKNKYENKINKYGYTFKSPYVL